MSESEADDQRWPKTPGLAAEVKRQNRLQEAHEANCRAYAEAGRAEKALPDIIVKLALRIARAKEQAKDARATASRVGRDTLRGVQFEQWASSLDSDVCQLCTEMQRACRGEVGPFPSDSWSHLNEG